MEWGEDVGRMRMEVGVRWDGDGDEVGVEWGEGDGMRMLHPSSPTLLGQAELPGLPPARRLDQLRGMMEKRGWGSSCCRAG